MPRRYLGEVRFAEGIWAGIEVQGPIDKSNQNDGAVESFRYVQIIPYFKLFESLLKYCRIPTVLSQTSTLASADILLAQKGAVSSYKQDGVGDPSYSDPYGLVRPLP